jgi:lycopene beta-cyclase
VPDAVDVLVAGAGPAGLALAAACARLGLSTALADRGHVRALGRRTARTARRAIGAAPAKTLAIGTTENSLCRRYVIVDNGGLRDWLTDESVRLLTGRGRRADYGRQGATVVIGNGSRIAAGVVVDATGARRTLCGGRPAARTPTEVGIVLGTTDAERLVSDAGDIALFMDWRPPPRVPSVTRASFTPSRWVADGHSSRRLRWPAGQLDQNLLAARLQARLTAAGVKPLGRQERVRIPLDLPPSPTR